MNIAKRIRELRESKQWTQKEAAERAGIPRNNLLNFEKGYRQPCFRHLEKLSKGFHISLDQFFRDETLPEIDFIEKLRMLLPRLAAHDRDMLLGLAGSMATGDWTSNNDSHSSN
jgi:transcriptional regulator with XRE-family HTH domain